jgi:hypothetical protein
MRRCILCRPDGAGAQRPRSPRAYARGLEFRHLPRRDLLDLGPIVEEPGPPPRPQRRGQLTHVSCALGPRDRPAKSDT